MGFFFQAANRDEPDQEVYTRELELASAAEPLGFDSVWTAEHHWTEYAMSPGPLQFLAYMAGKTKRIQLGTHILVLPWHKPERLVGEIAELDNLSNGRFILGIGRGLGKHEFDGFGLDMTETRDRFWETAQAVVQGLEQGYIEYSGKYVNVPKRMIRPAPVRSFRDRTYGAAVSPESLDQMAELGSGLVIIPQKPWEVVERELVQYRTKFEELQGRSAPKPVVAVHLYVDHDSVKATELGQRNNQMYYHRIMEMYGLNKTHLQNTKGYEYYGKTAARIAESGEDKAAEHYANLHVYGNPRECMEKIEWIKRTIDADHLVCFFAYGGFSYDQSRASLELFNEEMRPVLQEDRAFSTL